jgi:hypothetical protein
LIDFQILLRIYNTPDPREKLVIAALRESPVGTKDAACSAGAKPELLGQNFQSCLEEEAREHERTLEELMRDAQ